MFGVVVRAVECPSAGPFWKQHFPTLSQLLILYKTVYFISTIIIIIIITKHWQGMTTFSSHFLLFIFNKAVEQIYNSDVMGPAECHSSSTNGYE